MQTPHAASLRSICLASRCSLCQPPASLRSPRCPAAYAYAYNAYAYAYTYACVRARLPVVSSLPVSVKECARPCCVCQGVRPAAVLVYMSMDERG